MTFKQLLEQYRAEALSERDKGDRFEQLVPIDVKQKPYSIDESDLNGKSAIDWIMERYQITTHKDSGITNDSNDWSAEVGNPRYILDLLLSVINLSVDRVKLVKGLPEVRF